MAEGNLYNKDVKVKGIDTASENGIEPEDEKNNPILENPDEGTIDTEPKKEEQSVDNTLSEIKEPENPDNYMSWENPETEQETFEKSITTGLGQPGDSSVKGDPGVLDTEKLNQAVAPINLGKYIPDPLERKKFLEEKGQNLLQLDQSTYGVTFENDMQDLVRFKQTQYPKKMKRFLDQLDENQGFVSEIANMGGRFIGSTALSVSSIIPFIYGLGNAAWEGDASKIFDNPVSDAWETSQDWITENTVVYGGSNVYNYDNNTGQFEQKEFFARFWNDPIKSINQDVVPAASFIAGAVITELLATGVAPFTGGTSLAANTARLATQAKKLFSGSKFFSTSMKAIRGLDDNILQMAKLKNSAQYKTIQKSLNEKVGTAVRGIRSAQYESALIARDTQERTLNNLLIEHHKKNGGKVDEEGNPIGEMIEPDKAMLAGYERTAADAGEMGYFMNIPLVAGSNFVQFPKLMMRNYSLSRIGGKLMGKQSLKGTRYVDGKRVANVDANKYLKALGYAKASVKGGITEGWEEFAQEALGEGLVDYYGSEYSKDSAKTYAGMLSAIADQGSAVLSSAQGRDSVTVGALMGMLGMRLPVKIDEQTGKPKFSLKGTGFGGIGDHIRQTKKSFETARKKAEILNKDLNENNVNPILASNFRSAIRHIEAQKNMDSAAIEGDINEYKNNEHQQMFTFVQNRMNQGLEETILEDIEIEKESTLEEFNKKYSRKNKQDFTEESKKEAIEKAEKRVKNIIKDINTVNSHIENNEHTGINKIGFELRKLAGNKNQKPLTSAEIEKAKGIQEQMAYLYSSVENSKEREEALSKIIDEKSKRTFDISLLDAIKANPKGIVINEKSENAEAGITFNNNANEVGNSVLQEWKKQNPEEYNLHSESVKQELKDIIKLKLRRAKAAAMYKGMFTYKGAKNFRKFAHEIHKKREEALLKELRETVKDKSENAKNASLGKTQDNEKSIFGESPIADKTVEEDIRKGIKEYDDLNKDALSSEGLFDEIIDILEKYPGLLTTVLAEGKEKGLSMQGIKTAEELRIEDTDDGALQFGSITLMNDISKAWKKHISNPQNQPKFDNAEDYNQPTKNDSVTKGETEFNTKDTEPKPNKHKENILFVNLNEKALQEIDGTTVAVRDENGKIKDHIATENSEYKIDFQKINSPGFLNNEVLEKENHEFEFRIPEDNEWNRQDNTTTDNLWIDVVYVNPKTKKETVVGRLETYKEDSPQYLKNLREEIVRRQELMDNQTENTELAEIKSKKKEVKEKLQELQQEAKETISKKEFDKFINEGTVSDSVLNQIASKVKEGETLTERETAIFNDKTSEVEKLLKETTEEQIESPITKLELVERKENLTTKAKEHYETAVKEHPEKTLEDVSELQEMIDSLTNSPKDKAIKKGVQLFIDEINFENQSKVSPETEVEQDANEEIQKEIEELKSELSSLNEQLTKESEKGLVFKTELDNKNSELINKVKEYTKIKNKKKKKQTAENLIKEFGQEEFYRALSIENNFDSIVTQIIESGINIFKPENPGDQFKEC